MAKTAAQRRATRKRKEHDRSRRRAEQASNPAGPYWSPGADSPWERPDRRLLVRQLLVSGASAADEQQLERIAAELAVLDPGVDGDGQGTDLLLSLFAALWEHGWQPADAAHVVRRQGRVRMTRLALAAIARQARVSDAAARAPEEWLAQLDALDTPPDPEPAVVAAWRVAVGLPATDAWLELLRLLALLNSLAALQELTPPPSQWDRRRARPRKGPASADTRMLGRIRALLAKAESTEFPEEAEALTAKAQELMTRYAVDEAVLDAERGESLAEQVRARRVHLENPYPDAKMQLLNAVGAANGVKVIVIESLGIATMVGLPVDVELVELLFTSLLVQATRAMAAAGRAGNRSTRSPSFRRSFLVSYAIRIGERLAEVRDSATEEATASRGAALVPVLRERSEAVDDVFARLFPETTVIGARATNLHGWRAGRLAAETADLGSGREQVRG